MINVGTFASSGGGTAYDSDAQAFFTATGITDLTQKNTVNQLVLDLKSANYWNRIKLLLPMVGGSSSTCNVNLRDTSTFTGVFSSGWTIDSSGAKPNGVSAYYNTGFNLRSNLSINNISVIHTTNENTQGGIDFGDISTQLLVLISRYSNGNAYGSIDNTYNPTASTLIGGTTAFTVDSGKVTKLFKNGSQIGSDFTSTQTQVTNGVAYLGAHNQSGGGNIPFNFSSRRVQMLIVGEYFNPTEIANITTYINTFNTSLLR
jgi:hypothetical protein